MLGLRLLEFCQAQLLSTALTANSTDTYCGYFHALNAQGAAVRLGFQDPTTGTNSGLGITQISEKTAKTQWDTGLPLLTNHSLYVSLTVNGTHFLSLAPRNRGVGSLVNLDLVQWSLAGTAILV